MRSRAESSTTGYGFGDMQPFQPFFSNHAAQNTCDDDDGHRNGDVSSQLLGDANAYGRGDGLGQEGDIRCMVQAEEQGQYPNDDQTGEYPRNNAGHDGPLVVLEQINLLIKRYSQANGRGSEQVSDDVFKLDDLLIELEDFVKTKLDAYKGYTKEEKYLKRIQLKETL